MLAARANRFARWALDQGLAKGDTVCLMMPNRPEYMAIWLGLCSVGVTAALINTQLRGRSLAHCLDIATAKHAIVAAEFGAELRTAAAQMENPPQIWVHGDDGNQYERIDRAVERFSGEPLTPAERRAITITDRALLIYTSGTTGLPKAANVSHRRLLQWSFWFAGLMNTGPDDRMYDCLPMYHSVGGVVATGAVLVRGGSVLIRDKFSAQLFWDDIADWDCTLFQYIGELARYLAQRAASLRASARIGCAFAAAMGFAPTSGRNSRNGSPFRASSSSTPRPKATSRSITSRARSARSAASRRFSRHRFPLALVKFDAAAGEPARGADGFCIRCETNETGEAIGRIPRDTAQSGGEFEGYTERKDTEQKILRNVFEPGDAWFRTGDLMRMDESRLFLFRRPDRRYVPLEGRERGHGRSRRGRYGISRHQGRDRLRRSRTGLPKAPPAWRRSSRRVHWICQSCTSILRSGYRTMHGQIPAHRRQTPGDFDLQAQQDRTSA